MNRSWERRGRAAMKASVAAGLCVALSACASTDLNGWQKAVNDAFAAREPVNAAEANAADAALLTEASLVTVEPSDAGAAAGDAYDAPNWVSRSEREEDEAAAAEDAAEGGGFGAVFEMLANAVSGDEDEADFAETAAPGAATPTPVQSVAVERPAAAPQPTLQAASADLTRNRARARNLSNQRLHDEAAEAWRSVIAAGGGAQDQLDLISSLVRSERWDAAEAELGRFPQARNSERGLMLAAIVYDQQERWDEADVAYQDALALSRTPHIILNNWGVSAMSRGQTEAATEFFARALRHRPDFANAKANLALARGLNGDYSLPAVDFTEAEKAAVLHDLGLIAYRRGKLDEAEERFRAALETHPRYYRKAADMLLRIEKTRGGVRDL